MHPHATGATEKATAPYGSWESPITAAAVSAAGRTVEGLAVASDGCLVWVEKRPEEGGYVRVCARPSIHLVPFPFPRANFGKKESETVTSIGRASVLVRGKADPGAGGKAVAVTPRGFAVRTLAQEYGGGSGAFAVQGDTVVFSNYDDQRLYRQTIGGTSSMLLYPITAAMCASFLP